MSAVKTLRDLQQRLNALKAFVRNETGTRISRAAIRTAAERIGTEWFSDIKPLLSGTALTDETLSRYSKSFQRLVKISAPNNHKSSYIETLDALTKKFRADLILPLQTTPRPRKPPRSIRCSPRSETRMRTSTSKKLLPARRMAS